MDLPHTLLEDIWEEMESRKARERAWMMRDHLMATEWGMHVEYIGKDREPEPTYKYDESPRRLYLRELERRGGILQEVILTPEEQEALEVERDRAAWKKFMNDRRGGKA